MNSRAPLLMNTTSAAEYVGVEVSTFRRWMKSGDFTPKPVRRGGSSRPYWRRQELDAFVNGIEN
jgi:predicted DNA-binding transcriptional regulator AlpA